jgi:hypothetical protein
MAYLDLYTDIKDESSKATIKLKDDIDVQSMFRSVENEKEPHRLYVT